MDSDEIKDIEEDATELKEMKQFKSKSLKIILVTNIPSEKDYEREVFTFGKLANEDISAKIKPDQLPIFTYRVLYDESDLSGLSYNDILKTFFDKKEFFKRFSKSTEKLGELPTDDMEDIKKEKYYKKKSQFIHANIMLTLKYLLPTRFPVVNNHFTSYDLFKGNDRLNTLLHNPFSRSIFTYLKLKSGIFTIKKVIWLNDFLNHPEYKKLTFKEKSLKSSNNALKEELAKIGNDKTKQSDLLKEMRACYKTSCRPQFNGYLDVGINENDGTNDDDGNAEIFVDVELFEEQLKPENESDVKCPYYGDHLGEELVRLMKETDPKKKPLNGKITKMPLFSIKNLTSRKLGEVEKVAEVIDEKEKARIEQENKRYDQEDEEIRDEYEKNINTLFKIIEKSTSQLKNQLKRYKINKKTFYFFLEYNFPTIFSSITDSSYKKFVVRGTMIKEIDNKIDEEKRQRARYQNITVDEFNKKKAMYEMVRLLVEEDQQKPNTFFKYGKVSGGYSIKKRKFIKRRTRKQSRNNN
jgi:hypothetical protein